MAPTEYTMKFGPEDSELVPDGRYSIALTKFETHESKAGNPTIWAFWEIAEGDYIGRGITDFITLTETTEWRLARFLKGIEIPWKKGETQMIDAQTQEINYLPLIGRTCYADVRQRRDNQGQMRNNIQSYIPASQVEAEGEQETF